VGGVQNRVETRLHDKRVLMQ